MTNVIVRPLPTGWGQAVGQQPGEHGQPGNRLPSREQALSTGQVTAPSVMSCAIVRVSVRRVLMPRPHLKLADYVVVSSIFC